MIKQINLSDPDALEELFTLQREAYRVEADLIGFSDIPPLKETPKDLAQCGESFLGCYIEKEMAGAVSYTVDSDIAVICRMVVHPKHFRKGIARRLLQHLYSRLTGIHILRVSTGKQNGPGVELYTNQGFRWMSDREVMPGFFISVFEKELMTKNTYKTV
ncbi:GNAT family N-acetyltransferase [Peribacillus sp. SCS-155]|uniref:GNAT family N-acetyltransferase n=1 Tax=Peribacillus sedimenti TaxID=3115297 RepID=UPI0039061792